MKVKFRVIVLIVALLLAIQVGAAFANGGKEGEESHTSNVRAVGGDCNASGSGRFLNNPGPTISFTCAAPSIVYFGICDDGPLPEDDLLSITFGGRVVSRNDYANGVEIVVIGSGQSEAGSNSAIIERLNFIENDYATYAYAVSADPQEVESALAPVCGADLQVIAQQITLGEEVIPIGPGQTVATDDQNPIEIGDYPTVYFRASWTPAPATRNAASKSDGAASENAYSRNAQKKDVKRPTDGGSITAIVDLVNNEPVDLNGPGVTSVQGETFYEVAVEDLPPGQYQIQFTADDTFSAPEVTLGAYTFDFGSGGGQLGAIQGRVFSDENRNGVLDAGEFGIPGVSVTLYSPGDWHHTFTTGEGGVYHPVALGKVYWDVEVTVPEGYEATSPTRIEGIGIGIDGNPGGAVGVDFGLAETGSAAAATSSSADAGTAPTSATAPDPPAQVVDNGSDGDAPLLLSILRSVLRSFAR